MEGQSAESRDSHTSLQANSSQLSQPYSTEEHNTACPPFQVRASLCFTLSPHSQGYRCWYSYFHYYCKPVLQTQPGSPAIRKSAMTFNPPLTVSLFTYITSFSTLTVPTLNACFFYSLYSPPVHTMV